MARTFLFGCLLVLAGLAESGWAAAGTWFGNDVVAANRALESFTGKQIHVVYACPADGADRIAAYANAIVSDAEAVDAWWRRQDPTRALRCDLFPFPGCGPGIGRLDLTRTQLPRPASEYFDIATTLRRLADDLAAEPFSPRPQPRGRCLAGAEPLPCELGPRVRPPPRRDAAVQQDGDRCARRCRLELLPDPSSG